MINTSDFRTQTITLERTNPKVENYWPIALDIGYSAVKGMSPNSVYCFPSYAKRVPSESIFVGAPSHNDIQYRDLETNEVWAVGAFAQDMIVSDDTNDSLAGLFGRNRYFSPIFKVISRVGLALGMFSNAFGNPQKDNLVIQTGLPPKYLKSDEDLLKEALAGEHTFEIKVGSRPWVKFDFTLPEENIRVTAQPMGTLLSIATDNEGRLVPEAQDYFSSGVFIFDPGFGTLDIFDIRAKRINSFDTNTELGMKRVLQETANDIFNKYKVEIALPAMQKFLQEGNVTVFNRKERTTKREPFAEILEAASKRVCIEALESISPAYNYFKDHKYFVITGGTSAAWKDTIIDYFKGMETLQVVEGNKNDTLPYIFSNCRGYYMYLYSILRKLVQK